MQDYRFDERFDKYPIAMAYVPWQHFDRIFENLRMLTKRVRFSRNWINLLREGDVSDESEGADVPGYRNR